MRNCYRFFILSFFVVSVVVILEERSIAQVSAPATSPNPMVWEQGINDNPQWRRLGCPHSYANDLEKAEMISKGLCTNANSDGSIKDRDAKPDANAATWKVLGCPRDYESDADLEDMKQAGLCTNVVVVTSPK